VALPFRTISQGEKLFDGRVSDQPSLRILTAAEQVDLAIPQDDRVPGSRTHVIADQVRRIDYERFFVIIVLQGVQSSGGYKVTIQQVQRHGDQVRVQAQFVSPSPGQGVTEGDTDPYHIVQVAKDGVWGGPIRFTLTDTDNHVLVELVREVP
jgi:hypothetical protein